MIFHLTSDSCKDIYPDNDIHTFRTKFSKPMRFEGAHEIAITDISFPNNFQNITAQDTEFFVYNNVNYEKFYIKAGFYTSVVDLITTINETWRIKRDTTRVLGNDFRLVYNDNTQLCGIRWTEHPKPLAESVWVTGIGLNPTLKKILGFFSEDTDFIRDLDIPREVRPEQADAITEWGDAIADITARLHSFYVYTDVVENVCMGGQQLPLLKMVPLSVNNASGYCHLSFQNPEYHRLKVTLLDVMLIYIRSKMGLKLPFPTGALEITLRVRAIEDI